MSAPLLIADDLAKFYGSRVGCRDVSFRLDAGEVLAIVGESGSGKTTLLNLLSGRMAPDRGAISYRMRGGELRDLASLSEAERRHLARTDWGFVHQDAAQGLRMNVSAGGNIGERLMGVGDRHYGNIRAVANDWLKRVEIDPSLTALCAQNIADNGFAARARAVSADVLRPASRRAAGLAPSTRFNPVLLKPGSDRTSQLVVRGRAIGQVSAVDYIEHRERLGQFCRQHIHSGEFTNGLQDSVWRVVLITGEHTRAEIKGRHKRSRRLCEPNHLPDRHPAIRNAHGHFERNVFGRLGRFRYSVDQNE